MKHTTGEWSINKWTQPDDTIGVGAIGTPLIARVILRDVSINEQKANAKLIAAAPELLDALIELKQWVGKLEDWKGVDPPCDIVDNAIKKATE